MLKIQAKQIEILKVEKSQIDSVIDQESYGYNYESVEGTSRNLDMHYGGGDTGGPSIQSAKQKEAENLKISNIRFSSKNFQTEISAN